jgi:tRNA 2-thiouridine synthesizing protein E
MSDVTYDGKTYSVDADGFLLDTSQWDEGFAKGSAPAVKIPERLTKEHWDIIHSIRNLYRELGRCPMVHETCRKNRIHLKDLETLFPTGYLRGACKLAGITYKEGYISLSHDLAADDLTPLPEKTYSVDVRGFLIDPEQWDEQFAVYKAHEMKMPDLLRDKHWRIIHFIRDTFRRTRIVPTVYETCAAQNMGVKDLEKLFPDGYHRGAVKIAGLRVR